MLVGETDHNWLIYSHPIQTTIGVHDPYSFLLSRGELLTNSYIVTYVPACTTNT